MWVMDVHEDMIGFFKIEVVYDGNLLSFLLRCGTRPYEGDTQ